MCGKEIGSGNFSMNYVLEEKEYKKHKFHEKIEGDFKNLKSLIVDYGTFEISFDGQNYKGKIYRHSRLSAQFETLERKCLSECLKDLIIYMETRK